MYCHKCGKYLPNEGYVCKFCGALMTKEQIENQKRLNNKASSVKLKSELYGGERIIYKKEKEKNNLTGIFFILGIIIFLIILAIILNVL